MLFLKSISSIILSKNKKNHLFKKFPVSNKLFLKHKKKKGNEKQLNVSNFLFYQNRIIFSKKVQSPQVKQSLK